jgi:hypothetical protein
MVLNLLLLVGLLAFQQVFNICLFVTKTEPVLGLTRVIHTFENTWAFNYFTL